MTVHYSDDLVTLHHGDALDVLAAIPDQTVGAIITDPPYNISDRNGRDGTTAGRLHRADGTTREVRRDFGQWDRGWDPAPFLAQARRVLRPAGTLIAFTSEHLLAGWLASGLNHRGLIAWRKSNPPPQFPQLYVRSLEWAVWQVNGPGGWVFNAGGYRPDCYEGPIVPAGQRVHPAQKPVWLMRELVRVHTNLGDVVVDPYAGSGSTLVAARDLGRRAVGVEFDEGFCRAAAGRLSQGVLPLWSAAS